MATEHDYIGPDPVAWVERLSDVNRGAQFRTAEKSLIAEALGKLRTALLGLRDGS